MLKNLFKTREVNDSILRPLGAGLSILYPLLIGLLINNMELAQFAVLGAFSFLAYQRISIAYNIKATLLHGLCLVLAFGFGIGVSNALFILPFAISMLSFAGYMIVKIYRIPKPAHFFVLMLFATGTNLHLLSVEIPKILLYLSIGALSGLVNAVIISLIEKLPVKASKARIHHLSLKDKYYVLLYERPKVWIDAIHFSFILFIAGYIAYLLRADYGYWVLISSAAVLSGEEIEVIKSRYRGRIVGSMIGVLFGVVLMFLHLSMLEIIIILMGLNVLIEYFMPRNYTIANFFTNPLVMLLSLLTTVADPTFLIINRLNGAILGSLLAALLISLMHYALRINNMEY